MFPLRGDDSGAIRSHVAGGAQPVQPGAAEDQDVFPQADLQHAWRPIPDIRVA